MTDRFIQTRLSVTDAQGRPVVGAPVTVEQTAHAFGFGNIAFDFVRLFDDGEGDPARRVFGGADHAAAQALVEPWLNLFNTATLPFYWRGFEPEPGAPDTRRLMAVAKFLVERGVTVKGHTLLWHTLAPKWLMGLSPAEVERHIRHRITRDVGDFAGVIDLWDPINEVVIMPTFDAEVNAITPLAQAKGRIEMIRLAFDTAREANPAARLVVNDFDLSVDYENLIEEILGAGIQVDAIGLQTHMHQGFRGEEAIAEILERFGRFGLPLQLTETSLVSGDLMPPHIVDLNDFTPEHWPSTPEGEARQADEIVRHYRTVLAHPLVESLTYWGITDAGAWLGAPIGLIRADGTRKPSYDALHGLIKGEWWHEPRTLQTDGDGNLTVTGWAGDYRLTSGDLTATFTVDGSGFAQVRMG